MSFYEADMTPVGEAGSNGGMSLRDYFAAKALLVIYADCAASSTHHTEIARLAYRLADAMLEAREQKAGRK